MNAEKDPEVVFKDRVEERAELAEVNAAKAAAAVSIAEAEAAKAAALASAAQAEAAKAQHSTAHQGG